MPIDLRLDSNEIPLLTDLYELTMAASYFAVGFNRPACFGMSVQSHRALAAVGDAFIFYERQRLMRFGTIAVNGDALELESPRRIEDLPHILLAKRWRAD